MNLYRCSGGANCRTNMCRHAGSHPQYDNCHIPSRHGGNGVCAQTGKIVRCRCNNIDEEVKNV